MAVSNRDSVTSASEAQRSVSREITFPAIAYSWTQACLPGHVSLGKPFRDAPRNYSLNRRARELRIDSETRLRQNAS
jgi:hypothetical protein